MAKLTNIAVKHIGETHVDLVVTFNDDVTLEKRLRMGATMGATAEALKQFALEIHDTAQYGRRDMIVIPRLKQ